MSDNGSVTIFALQECQPGFSMPTAVAQEVLTVPRDALVLRREGAFVYRIDDESVAEQVQVTTGLGAGNLIEVVGDLREGDRVVVRGAERLSTGAVVSISEDLGATSPGARTIRKRRPSVSQCFSCTTPRRSPRDDAQTQS